MNARKTAVLAGTVLAWFLLAGNLSAAAAGPYWTNATGDGLYGTADNWGDLLVPTWQADWWEPGAQPGSTGGTVVFDGDYNIGTANVAGNVVWQLQGHRYTPTTVYIGTNAPGHLTVADGRVGTQTTNIGNANISASLTIDAATWDALTLNVGSTMPGGGRLLVDGGRLVTANGLIGNGNLAVVTLTNQAVWLSQQDLALGKQAAGDASLEVLGQSLLQCGSLTAGESGGVARVTVSGAGSRIRGAGPLNWAPSGQASLAVADGGRVEWANMTFSMAQNAGSQADVSVSGPGSMLTNTSAMLLGGDGEMNLQITGGGTVSNGLPGGSSDAIYLANGQVGRANVTVSGPGSALLADGDLAVAGLGYASVRVADGGMIGSGGWMKIADASTARADVAVTGAGSRMEPSGDLYIAWSGQATVVVSDGALVTATWSKSVTMARDTGSRGTLTLTGAGTRLDTLGTVDLGYNGAATLSVLDGAAATIGSQGNLRNVTLAGGNGSAELTVDGLGSAMNIYGNLYVAGSSMGAGGPNSQADVAVSRGARLEVTDTTRVYVGGEVWVDGGELTTNKLEYYAPRLAVLGGGLLAIKTTEQTTLGSMGKALQLTLDGYDSIMETTGKLVAGKDAPLQLNITAGADLRVGVPGVGSPVELVMAEFSSARVEATVSGPGSVAASTGRAVVGVQGQATVNVIDGGVFVSGPGAWSESVIAEQTSSIAAVNVSGFGSLFLPAALRLGDGQASLMVSSGGAVRVGSVWPFIAGDLRTGGGRATIVVDGFGSRLEADEVYLNGPATTVIVTGGARMTARDLRLGEVSGSSAILTVDGLGSALTANEMWIGGYGGPGTIGALSIGAGAAVNVVQTLWMKPTGALTVDGGSLSARRLELEQVPLVEVRDGRITLTDPLQIGPATTLAMSGRARVQAQALYNDGVIAGGGEFVGQMLQNKTSGTVVVTLGEKFSVVDGHLNNNGSVAFSGATLSVGRMLTNAPGASIVGHGEIRVGEGLFNDGKITATDETDVYGQVTNAPMGEILLTGGDTTTFHGDVRNDGTITVRPGTSGVFLGSYSGGGTVEDEGHVYFEGLVVPGASPGVMSIGGDMTLRDTATLVVDLGGTTPGAEHDQLAVGGQAALNGALRVELYSGFLPLPGDEFRIVSAGSRGGEFETLQGVSQVGGQAGLWLDVAYEPDGVTLTSAALSGDVNLDGSVDVSDLSLLAGNFRKTAGQDWLCGDFNGDGAVDVSDLSILAGNFRKSLPAVPGGAPVPEPGLLALLAAGAVALLRRKR